MVVKLRQTCDRHTNRESTCVQLACRCQRLTARIGKCPTSIGLMCCVSNVPWTGSFVLTGVIVVYAFFVVGVLPLRLTDQDHFSATAVHQQQHSLVTSLHPKSTKLSQTQSSNSTESDLISPLTMSDFEIQNKRTITTERTSSVFEIRRFSDGYRYKRKPAVKMSSKVMEQRIWSVESASNVDETCCTERTATEEIEAFANYKYRYPVETSRLDARRKQPRLNSASAGIQDKLLLRYRLDLLSDIIYDGIYWSNSLEVIKPKGFGLEDDVAWIRLINASTVIDVSEGCGRMQNRLVVLEDKSMSCARHRQNTDQIQGELFSFQLARILGIPNLVPSTVSFGKNSIWNKVRGKLRSAKWNVEKPVVLTKYVNDLIPAYIPSLFRSSRRRLHPLLEDIGSLSKSELIELMQWSDLIVFDYLTANLDRVVNNLFNEQWNREMMNRPAHNLLRSRKSGLLLFIDNESGLLHGYRLLNEYESFHRSLLDSLCVFRKSTADSIESLHNNGNVSKILNDAFYKNGVNYEKVAFLPESNIKLLKHRIATVYRQIALCKSLYAPSKRTLHL